MVLDDFEAWITVGGVPLVEYDSQSESQLQGPFPTQIQSCYIAVARGTYFKVHWRCKTLFLDHSLYVQLYFHNKRPAHQTLRGRDLMDKQVVDTQPFWFGEQEITDSEHIADRYDLNVATIRLELRWVMPCPTGRIGCTNCDTSHDNKTWPQMNSRPSAPSRLQLGVVHRAAKAHDIAALSNFYDQGESLNLRDRKWHETASQKRTIFVFRYGPENWMVARGLISPKVQTLQNVKPPTEKHASPERNAIEIAIEPEDVKPRITPPLANAIVKHEPSSNANTDQFSSKSPDAEQTVPTQIEVMDLCDSDSEPEDIKPQVTPPPANVTIKQEPSSAGNDQSDLDKIAGIVGQLAQEFGQMRDGIAQTNAGLRQMNENIAGLVQVLERKA